MSSQAMTTARSQTAPRRFNPKEYSADFHDLMQVNPKLAVNAATALAASKREIDRQLNFAEDQTSDLIAFAVSTGLVALVGWYDGSVMKRRDALIDQFEAQGLIGAGEEPPRELWKAQGVKEPGKLWIFPTSLLIPIVLGAAAIGVAAGRDEDERPSTLERTLAVTATTTFGLFVAGYTRAAGYRWQEKRMITAGTQAAMTGTY
jgi:hypothetical protein